MSCIPKRIGKELDTREVLVILSLLCQDFVRVYMHRNQAAEQAGLGRILHCSGVQQEVALLYETINIMFVLSVQLLNMLLLISEYY